MEVDGQGNDLAYYIYAGDERIAMIDKDDRLYYYLKEHLGSTRVTLRDNGVKYGKYYRYYTFGETQSEVVNLSQAYKYTGKPMDTEFDLDIYYYGARYYNSMLGRWLAVDPQRNKYPSWSSYVYVRNNPLLRTDLDGLTDIVITIQRQVETEKSTIGNYTVSNSGNKEEMAGVTLELPWKDNKVNESRIPAGTYKAALRTDKGTFSYPRIQLKGVPDRDQIVMHMGNSADDTNGCILAGKSAGKDYIYNSKTAIDEIGEYVGDIQDKDKKNGEITTITVKVIDPEKVKPISREQE